MYLRRIAPVAFLSAVMTLSQPAFAQLTFGQDTSGSQDMAITFPVGHYYRQFWQLRAEAFEQLDEIFLPEVMYGSALSDDEATVHQLEPQGRAEILVVENHPQIWCASPDETVIYDPYVSRSYFIDAKTRAPLGDGPNTSAATASVAYHLTQHPDHFGDLRWMVDAIAQTKFDPSGQENVPSEEALRMRSNTIGRYPVREVQAVLDE